jgi:hypothetical protein
LDRCKTYDNRRRFTQKLRKVTVPADRFRLHRLEIAVACLGLGAAVTFGLIVRRRWRQHQALPQAWYTPWIQPQRQRRQLPAQHQPPAVQDGGQHLHLHLTSPEQVEQILRQIRGQ